jgi:hypothetical protein
MAQARHASSRASHNNAALHAATGKASNVRRANVRRKQTMAYVNVMQLTRKAKAVSGSIAG